MILNAWFIYALEVLAVIGAAAYVMAAIKRLFVAHTATVSVATGDSESLTLQTNLSATDDTAKATEKLNLFWAVVQARRDENHRKWEEMKAKDLAEKTEALSNVKNLK